MLQLLISLAGFTHRVCVCVCVALLPKHSGSVFLFSTYNFDRLTCFNDLVFTTCLPTQHNTVAMELTLLVGHPVITDYYTNNGELGLNWVSNVNCARFVTADNVFSTHT